MRNRILVTALIVLTAQVAFAGAGSDQPTNIVVTTPYSDNINWAQVCWQTNNQSDSMVLIGELIDFSRQVYDPTLTTNHCVVVQNLQPGTSYYYSVASCTDPVGGKPCAVTDTNWSVAPWPTSTPTFATAPSNDGPLGFNAFAFGPSYVYQNTGINIGVSMIQTGGIVTSDDALLLTQATIDGQSCLPGGLLGSPCGNTNLSLTLVCNDSREEVNPPTDNYQVVVYQYGNYQGDYLCWNSYFSEPGVEARIVPLGQQKSVSNRRAGDSPHNLSMTFQIIDYKTNTPVTSPETVTWQFSVIPPAQFTVTPPTNFPPIPNYGLAIATAGQWGTNSCEAFKSANQQGIYLNTDLTTDASVNDPWDIFTYDGNRIFKEEGDRFDGVTGGSWQPHHAYNPWRYHYQSRL